MMHWLVCNLVNYFLGTKLVGLWARPFYLLNRWVANASYVYSVYFCIKHKLTCLAGKSLLMYCVHI
jgi:hypothetical protein